MTKEQLEHLTEEEREILARVEKATVGPWYAMDGSACGFDGEWDVDGPDNCAIASMAGTAEVAKLPRDKEANADFISNARADVPILLETIAALRARIAALEGAIEWYQEQAEASSRAVPEKRTDAMMAILTVMSLDGGRRARAALAARPEVKA